MSTTQTTERNRTAVQDLIQGILTGQLLDKFEQHYADDIVMSENGDPEQTRTGKDANRAYEQAFVANATFHDVSVGPVVADGDITAYEMTMDMTVFGDRVKRTQWAVQTWKDGQIVREVFHYAA